MIVNLQDLRAGPQEYDVRINPADLHLAADDLEFPEPVGANVRFQLFGERVRVTGRLETIVETHCVRCLQPTRKPIRAQVALVFEKRPPVEEATQRHPMEADWNAEARGIEFYEEERVDATESFRQLILLEAPGHPLCRESCRGLCPHCGVDLNKTQCSCLVEPAPVDDEPDWKKQLKNIRLD